MTYGNIEYDLQRCRDLLDEKDFEEAFFLATDLLGRAAESRDVVEVYADSALAFARPVDAVRACRRYLRGGERDPLITEWLLRAQWDLHLTEECLKTCRVLLETEPGSYTALDYGIACLLELGDFEGGGDIVDLAAEQTDDPHLAYQVAVARMMRGDEEWARRRFEQFLEEDPSEPGTYINLMRIHHLAKRYDDVETLYLEAIRREMDHADLHFNMGLALKARERDRESAKYFIRTVRRNAELPDAHFHLAQVLRGEGHPRLALSMLQRELGVDDTQPAVHAEMAWCAEDLGEYAEAVRMIEAAVERAPEWGVYLHSHAELLMKAAIPGREVEAIARAAVERDPEHAAGWQVLGRLAAERGEFKEAEEMLRRSANSKDATVEDEGWLGLIYAQTNRPADARPLLERAARTYPFWQPVGDALGRILGHAVPCRFEVRLTRSERDQPYRVLHVVAPDETGAREAVRVAGADQEAEPREVVEEVLPLGFELDRAPGVVWDSGPSRSRYPRPPEEPAPG